MQHYLQMLPETGNCRHIGVRGKIIFFSFQLHGQPAGSESALFPGKKEYNQQGQQGKQTGEKYNPYNFFHKDVFKKAKRDPQRIGGLW